MNIRKSEKILMAYHEKIIGFAFWILLAISFGGFSIVEHSTALVCLSMMTIMFAMFHLCDAINHRRQYKAQKRYEDDKDAKAPVVKCHFTEQ